MSARPPRPAGWIAAPLLALAAGCAAHGGTSSTERAGGGPPRSSLLARHCGNCHAVPRPRALSGRRWLDGLTRMRRRIRLPESDWDTLAAMALGDTTARAPGR